MYILITLTIVICALLGLFVLIQNPKGGLASGITSSSQLLGVKRTGNVLEKGTWILAIGIMVLALAINVIVR